MKNGDGLAKIATDSQAVDWFKMIAEWEKSGLTRQLFCEQYQLDYHQLLYQRAKSRKTTRASSPPNWLSIPRGENTFIPAPEAGSTAPSPDFLLKTIQGLSGLPKSLLDCLFARRLSSYSLSLF